MGSGGFAPVGGKWASLMAGNGLGAFHKAKMSSQVRVTHLNTISCIFLFKIKLIIPTCKYLGSAVAQW